MCVPLFHEIGYDGFLGETIIETDSTDREDSDMTTCTTDSCHDNEGIILKHNLSFIEDMIKLQSLSKTLLITGSDDEVIIKKTAFACTGSVLGYITKTCQKTLSGIMEHRPFSFTLMNRATVALSALCDSAIVESFREELLEKSFEFVVEVSKEITTCEEIGRHKVLEDLSTLLVSLAMSEKLRVKILEHLFQHIQKTSDHLRQVTNASCFPIAKRARVEQLNPSTVETVHYIFTSCDEILQKELLKDSRNRAIGQNVCRKLKEKVEDSLLHISETFPLFAILVWKLVSVLDALLDSSTL